jgi:hypothetical protein
LVRPSTAIPVKCPTLVFVLLGAVARFILLRRTTRVAQGPILQRPFALDLRERREHAG